MNNHLDNLYPWLQPCFDDILSRIKTQNLHHGLLFVADKGCGENALCELVAKALLCQSNQACDQCKSCLLFSASSHPDLLKVLSDKPSIGIDAIRDVSEFVNTTSQLLSNKVVLISDIERMTESASNALLKTLEEPNNNTYLILSTNQPDRLLATIKSRCEKIRLSLPGNKEAIDWLSSQSNKKVDKLSLLAYSGSPIDYLAALEQNNNLSHSQFMDDFCDLLEAKVSAIVLADKWQNEASLALKWCYQLLIRLQQECIVGNTETIFSNRLNQDIQFDYELLVSASDECQLVSKPLSQAGINKVLILERIFNYVRTSVNYSTNSTV